MKEKRFVVYWNSGSVIHYFATYEEAKKYVVTNNQRNCNIAYLLAYTESPPLIELGGCREEVK